MFRVVLPLWLLFLMCFVVCCCRDLVAIVMLLCDLLLLYVFFVSFGVAFVAIVSYVVCCLLLS